MNELSDLKAKIDSEPANAQRTDAEVLDWLRELEAGPFVDVPPEVYFDWSAKYKLPGRYYATANTVPASNLQSAALMLHTAWVQNAGLQLSSLNVRAHLGDAVPSIISIAARDELLEVARPDVPRWVNAAWEFEPILGDVVAARNLP